VTATADGFHPAVTGVSAGGAITQSGALTVTGRTTLAAGASDITLTQAGNNFLRVDVTSANHVALTDSDALMLGTSTVSGALDITNNGALTQGGALTVGTPPRSPPAPMTSP